MTGLLELGQLLARAKAAAAAHAATRPGFCDRVQYHLALAEPLDRPIGSELPASGYLTAAAHWAAIPAAYRVPSGGRRAGDLAFFTGGSSGGGHVELLISSSLAVSSDLPNTGQLGVVPILEPQTRWGLRFAGYARQYWHGATLPPEPVPVPTILPLVGYDRKLGADGQWSYRRVSDGHVIVDPLPPAIVPGGHWKHDGTRWYWSVP